MYIYWKEAMTTTRKIGFAVLLVLFLNPIIGQASEYGKVVTKSTSTMLLEGAVKAIPGPLVGKAMSSIFPPDQPKPSPSDLAKDIKTASDRIMTAIEDLPDIIQKQINKQTDGNYQTDVGMKADAVGNLIKHFKADTTAATLTTFLVKIDDYSSMLDRDIKIGLYGNSGFNGFWRSFPEYIENKAKYTAFNIQLFRTKLAEGAPTKMALHEYGPLAIASTISADLNKIYLHLANDVPTLPIAVSTKKPVFQPINCVARTDPETQLFTSKGEFISRYASPFDVADINKAPDELRYWTMYAHCRSDQFKAPPVQWRFVNFTTAPANYGGPSPIEGWRYTGYHNYVKGCRSTVTFGQCKVNGDAYGCRSSTRMGKSSRAGWNSDTNEIEGYYKSLSGRFHYTRNVWNTGNEALPVFRGSSALDAFENSHNDNVFYDYLREYENTVCRNDPSGKKITLESAPDLAHLQYDLFDGSTLDYSTKPEWYKNHLPTTVIRVPSTVAEITDEGAVSTNHRDTFVFIKRHADTYRAELSKNYRSPWSASRGRSLHYLDEYRHEFNLHTDREISPYCDIAALVGTGLQLLNTQSKILDSEQFMGKRLNYGPDDEFTITQEDINNEIAKYAPIMYKLGISKENVAARCGGTDKPPLSKIQSNNQFITHLDLHDKKERACLLVAAIQKNDKQREQMKKAYGNSQQLKNWRDDELFYDSSAGHPSRCNNVHEVRIDGRVTNFDRWCRLDESPAYKNAVSTCHGALPKDKFKGTFSRRKMPGSGGAGRPPSGMDL